jgi:hypothetical protein
LGIFAGYLLAAHARHTDLYHRRRRRKKMMLAATLQWDLLPPLTFTVAPVAVAGILEPAYEVGGDCFDYAANTPALDFMIMDAMVTVCVRPCSRRSRSARIGTTDARVAR